MALILMYITNDEKIARIAEDSGVDWIFIDLEIIGKEKRQGHLDTVISRHSIEDVKKIKNVLSKSQLLVRVNPLNDGSKYEIDKVINDGADIVMLPYFKTKNEVETFIDYVNNRAKVCLLCETAEAVENIDDILIVPGIDYIHIGLNDLHLSYGMNFMFELLAAGTVEMLCKKFKEQGIRYGFGGVARLGDGILPAENIIAEHYRLGSSMVILSRSFCNTKIYYDINLIEKIFKNGIREIREYEKMLSHKPKGFYQKNLEYIKNRVKEIVSSKEKSCD